MAKSSVFLGVQVNISVANISFCACADILHFSLTLSGKTSRLVQAPVTRAEIDITKTSDLSLRPE